MVNIKLNKSNERINNCEIQNKYLNDKEIFDLNINNLNNISNRENNFLIINFLKEFHKKSEKFFSENSEHIL